MKNHFIAIISILCALSLAFSAVPACADEVPATATDLQETEQEILQEETPGEPAAEPEQEGQPAGTADETATEPVAGNDNEPAETPGDEAQPEEKTAEETATEETAEAAAEEAQPGQEAPQEELVTEAEAPKVSAELIISKAVRMGGVWEGLTKDTNPATLKLDLDKAQKVHVIVEGRKVVWATVEKADRPESAPGKTLSDPETKRLIISFEAEQGSYLIRIGPEEPNRNAKVTVSFLDDEGYAAWEAALAEEAEQTAEETPEQTDEQETGNEPDQPAAEQPADQEPETEIPDENAETDNPETVTETETKTAPENEAETDKTDETEPAGEGEEGNRPESVLDAPRSIDVDLTWDTENPQIGDTAHLQATLNGYDALSYTLQWQYSEDDQNWTDAVGETGDRIDITITEENNYFYWRILVYIEQPNEEQ